MNHLRSILSPRWTRALPALLTILLLAPAPVLAFTWVQPAWNVVSTLNTGGAPAPTFISDASPTTPSTLTVDMGTLAPTAGQAGEQIELSRQLKITGASENVSVGSSYTTVLQNARLNVRVWFVPVIGGQGAYTSTLFNFTKSAGKNQKTVSDNGDDGPTVKHVFKSGSAANAGNYVAHVKITYETNSDGNTHAWSNASPHKFTFQGPVGPVRGGGNSGGNDGNEDGGQRQNQASSPQVTPGNSGGDAYRPWR